MVVDSRIFSYWPLIILTGTVMNFVRSYGPDEFMPVGVICVDVVGTYLSRQARHDGDDSLISSVSSVMYSAACFLQCYCEILRK